MAQEATMQEIDACNRKIEQHNRNIDELLKGIKSGFEDDIRQEVEGSLR